MVELREASFDDFENIIALMSRNDMEFKNKSPREWQYLWEDNPAILGSEKTWPIGWVLEDDNKGIVGFLGNIPILYEFKKRPLIAACISSWVVDAPFRNYSMVLINAYFNQKSADLFLNATANNDIAVKVFSAFKAKEAPIDSYDRVLFWIVNYQKFISSTVIKKVSPLGNVISLPLSLAMQGLDKLIGRSFKNESDNGISSLTSFDQRFDEFWETLKNRCDRFWCVRDRQSLAWHFRYALINKKAWIFVTEKNSRITSYAIFLRQDNTKIGLKRTRLVDFQTIDDDPAVLTRIISDGIKRCRKDGVDVMEIIGFNFQKRNIIKKSLPYKRKLACNRFFYKTKDKSLREELENPQFWDPCFFDGDASL